MRAAFAIPGDISTLTGGYVYARRVLHALPKLGCEVTHIALPDGFPKADAETLLQTSRILQALPADAPILLDGLAGGVLPTGLLNSLRAPVIMLCHHPLALETGVAPEEAKRLRAIERDALAACDGVITTSHATANILIRDYNVEAANLTVAPPGTDPAPRAPADGPCRILSVGSLTQRKRHDQLIQALAVHKSAEWSLRIAGPTRDAEVHETLQSLITQHGLQGRVTLRGSLSTSQLAAEYQNADLFALASEYEGFGMAFTEAMSHGLPTLGIKCAAVVEATAGGGKLVKPYDFTNEIGLLIKDTKARRTLSDSAWRTAQTFLRWPQTSAIIADVLKKAIP